MVAHEIAIYRMVGVLFLRERVYPMHDQIYAFIDAGNAASADPKVREYIRFIVSREGQECIQRDRKYLPLTAEVSRAQLEKLQPN